MLNGQGLAVAASPDGTRVYVGGDFTTVDGKSHRNVAAFDTATGALSTSFAASMGGEVRAIVATNSTVYVGGNFLTANGVAAKRLAHLSATGATLAWAASADDAIVNALAITPDQSTVFVGGRFASLDGATYRGIGAVDATTGALAPWNRRSHSPTPAPTPGSSA